MNNIYYLSHGGPGSGRYPLGSGDRPYQKFEGSRRRTNKISEYIRSRRAKKEEAKLQKKVINDNRKKYDEEEQKRRHDADKERILREGSATEVMQYKKELTNKELSEVAERLRLERQISSYSEKEIKTALDKIKKIQSYTNVSSALAKDGIELWNSFAAVYNATSNGKMSPLPLVGKGDGGKKK